MKKQEEIYVNSDKFDDAFDMGSMPAWKAAGMCPFCSHTIVRLHGKYIEMDLITRSGTQKRKILTEAQAICRYCGATGPIEKREIMNTYSDSNFVEHLSNGNRIVMLNALSRWNRRYSN